MLIRSVHCVLQTGNKKESILIMQFSTKDENQSTEKPEWFAINYWPNKGNWLGITGETIALDFIVCLRGRLLWLTQMLEQMVGFERIHFSLYNVLSRF